MNKEEENNTLISIVIPLFNESESVSELHSRIIEVMMRTGNPFEIIFVDDGSTDSTFEEIKKLDNVKGLCLGRNAGQTRALSIGIKEASGEIIITMDGDLENNPADIPVLLSKMEEGYDVVSGWRKDRWHNQMFTRKIPSLLANRLISKITRVRLHDHGSNFRAYKKEVFDDVVLLGDSHRMLSAYLGMKGARVTEIPISYSARKYGKSKYGLSRTFKVLLDVLAFYFFDKYASKPIHFFGYVGFVSFVISGLIALWSLYYRIFLGVHFNRTPLPILFSIFFVVGILFILMGLLAEIIVRINAKQNTAFFEERIVEKVEN